MRAKTRSTNAILVILKRVVKLMSQHFELIDPLVHSFMSTGGIFYCASVSFRDVHLIASGVDFACNN